MEKLSAFVISTSIRQGSPQEKKVEWQKRVCAQHACELVFSTIGGVRECGRAIYKQLEQHNNNSSRHTHDQVVFIAENDNAVDKWGTEGRISFCMLL